ncbi:hypothetical protein COV53_06300 [Candidatus Gottesmanbacteria bacterium CG11_big_fil_rev_8_21_14_0_20_37_11]|uniref:Uncharacterized protein n=3 Tax=Candidatus Gottesmaniibacteriota TaxID=1752720 RepID=A0A2M7RS04_9BACT|nr:MAG: hypothetical protein AUJ73_00065 [Candidatus Gottesmanbacteria bacterium CG1_02_37_22]PIP32357.1 MAG: hypothetical protein COX23_05195 [Candidatus Gottesmanbacteria bacterium CG23_combo_of_CG06-09_8_20_14_all_37_19]PIR07827.1 MAG: hypothetical protein COV53_06300 [Candidatus Gottesmanbacteria bacterium CG11_big_fil_rev_8_21_14_0_20_37_11]PIZ02845.1 MAG: hypothetical protein COY59_02690 [Candidatus Gottesmanbacteria bacterium CG_4_10_14_0_8_um_filter_37_24]
MGKKTVVTILVILLIALGLIYSIYIRGYLFQKVVSPIPDIQPTSEQVEVEMNTWVDQSEFKVNYPKNLKINPHDEDKENYAHLEFTSEDHPGNIIIWVKDTQFLDLNDWMIKMKIDKAIDSNLGGIPSKKTISSMGSQKLTNTVIRNGYLYQIETNLKDAPYWQDVYNKIAASFEFVSPETQTSQKNPQSDSSSGGNEDFVADEEETIE